jgi:hypothetical protein
VDGPGKTLFAATYLSEARLSPFKSGVLHAVLAAQAGTAPRFPFLLGDRHMSEWAEAFARLRPMYANLLDAIEDDEAA